MELNTPSLPSSTHTSSGLLKRSFVYAFTKFLPRGVALLLVPVYTRYMSPDAYGHVNLAESFAALVAVAAAAGLPASINRFYNQANHDPTQQLAVLGTVLTMLLAMCATVGCLLLITGPWIVALFPGLSLPFYPLVAIASITAIFNQINQSIKIAFQSQNQSKYYAILDLGWFFLGVLGVLVGVVGMQAQAPGMLMGRMLAAMVFVCISLLIAARWLRHTPQTWSALRAQGAPILLFALPLIPHQLVAFMLTASDRFFLEYFMGSTQVGIYSLAYTVGSVMSALTMAAMLAWSPLFYKWATQPERRAQIGQTATTVLAVLTAAAIIGTALAEDVILVAIPPAYHGARKLASVVLGGYLLHAYFSVFHLGLMQSGRTGLLARVTVLAMLSNLLLNAALIPTYGSAGAAWATFIAYGVECLVVYWLSQRVFHIPYRWKTLLVQFLLYSTVLAAVWLSGDAPWRPVAVYGSALGALGVLAWLYRAELLTVWRALKQHSNQALTTD